MPLIKSTINIQATVTITRPGETLLLDYPWRGAVSTEHDVQDPISEKELEHLVGVFLIRDLWRNRVLDLIPDYAFDKKDWSAKAQLTHVDSRSHVIRPHTPTPYSM